MYVQWFEEYIFLLFKKKSFKLLSHTHTVQWKLDFENVLNCPYEWQGRVYAHADSYEYPCAGVRKQTTIISTRAFCKIRFRFLRTAEFMLRRAETYIDNLYQLNLF
jgi:hypothetical protein